MTDLSNDASKWPQMGVKDANAGMKISKDTVEIKNAENNNFVTLTTEIAQAAKDTNNNYRQQSLLDVL